MDNRGGLRPLALSAILDEATRLMRHRAGRFYGISLVATAPLVFAVIHFLRHVYIYSGPVDAYEPELLKRALLLGLALLLRWISHGALCAAAIAEFEGHPIALGEAWRRALRRSGSLIFLGLITWLCVGLGSLLFFIPGLLALGILNHGTYYVMVEERSYFSALRASLRDGSGTISKAGALEGMLAICVAMLAASILFSTPFFLGISSELFGFDASELRVLFSVTNPVFGIGVVLVAFVLVEPLRILALARLVLDQKIRSEGYDLLDSVSRLTGTDLRKVLTAAVLVMLAGQPVGAETVSGAEFLRRIDRAIAAIDQQLKRSERGAKLDLEALRAAGKRLDGLSIQGLGHQVAGGPDPLREPLEGLDGLLAEEASERLVGGRRRLEFIRGGAVRLAKARTAGALPLADPQSQVQEILARDRYRRRSELRGRASSSMVDSLMQRLVNWLKSWKMPDLGIWKRLKGVWKWLFGGWKLGGGKISWAKTIQWSVVVMLGVLGGVALWFIVRQILGAAREVGGQGPMLAAAPAPVVGRPIVAYETTEERWRSDARGFATRGEFGLAVRASFAGLLLGLNKEGWISYEKSRTNWEYQSEVSRRDTGLGERMQPLTETFDEKFYGRKDCSPEEYEAFREELDGLIGRVGGDEEAS